MNNMIPKQAIEKAIEGGWDARLHSSSDEVIRVSETHVSLLSKGDIALDPTFWRSLGKALNWSENKSSISAAPTWRTYAQEFYGYVLEERSTDDFWNDILNV